MPYIPQKGVAHIEGENDLEDAFGDGPVVEAFVFFFCHAITIELFTNPNSSCRPPESEQHKFKDFTYNQALADYLKRGMEPNGS